MQKEIELFGEMYAVKSVTHPKLGVGFEIDFAQMYEPPSLCFSTMTEISEMFGTKEIDFDNYSRGGCETCDYGSRYGYKIQVYKATKNIPEV